MDEKPVVKKEVKKESKTSLYIDNIAEALGGLNQSKDYKSSTKDDLGSVNKNDYKSTSIEKQDISEDGLEPTQSPRSNRHSNNFSEEQNNMNKNPNILNSHKKALSPEFTSYLERVEGYIKKKRKDWMS